MRKALLAPLGALLLVISLVPAAKADITVEDGGYEITVSYGDRFASVRKDNFRVTGTGDDAEEAVSIANKKAVERHADFGKSVDLLIGKNFPPAPVVVEKEVPVYIDRHHHHYHPVPAVAPVALPCAIPAGVVVDHWVVPYRRFRCSLGRYWYYDPVRVEWIRTWY